MANVTINQLPTAGSIDASADYLPIYTASSVATQKINRNTALGLTSGPLGLTDVQNVSSKTFDNTNTLTLKDALFTLQDDSDTTKQAKFQLSGITTGTTRTYTLPNVSDTLVTLGASQTLTNKTLTSPTINTPTITNATISADAITGFTVSNSGTIYGISVSTGVITTANSVQGAALTNSSVTANKLATGATITTVVTAETSASTSYTDLTTTGPSATVTIGLNGMALVIVTATQNNTTTSKGTFTSFVASGANTIAASDARALTYVSSAGGTSFSGSWTYLATGLNTGSTTFKLQYKVDANTGTWSNRNITVIPL